jgi:EAL and modified HD-GYP domain-containing signal transduction protein
VLEDVEVDERLQKCLQELASDGYTVALDDFVGQPHLLPLVDFAHIVKIDLRGSSPENLERWVSQLRRPGLKLLAEKVETKQEFEHCKELGFDYFQGFFLRRPETVQGRRHAANQVSVVRLLERLSDPRAGIHDLERLLGEDLDLSYQLVRLANSALVASGSPVISLGQALRLVGLRTITLWASLSLLSRLSNKPADVLHAAILRAVMCEHLAASVEPASASAFFLAGLFSALDILLDTPMEEALRSVSLSRDLERALLQREGSMGEALQVVLACERGNWDRLDTSRFDKRAITQAYLDAVAATEKHTAFLGTAEGP